MLFCPICSELGSSQAGERTAVDARQAVWNLSVQRAGPAPSVYVGRNRRSAKGWPKGNDKAQKQKGQKARAEKETNPVKESRNLAPEHDNGSNSGYGQFPWSRPHYLAIVHSTVHCGT